MTDERQKRMRELSAILARMRDLCQILQKDPASARFVGQLQEFSDLSEEAEARLRELEK